MSVIYRQQIVPVLISDLLLMLTVKAFYAIFYIIIHDSRLLLLLILVDITTL